MAVALPNSSTRSVPRVSGFVQTGFAECGRRTGRRSKGRVGRQQRRRTQEQMTCKQDSSDLAHLARIASMSGTGAFESRPLVILGNSPSHKNQECARTPSESAVRLGRIATVLSTPRRRVQVTRTICQLFSQVITKETIRVATVSPRTSLLPGDVPMHQCRVRIRQL